MTETEQTIDFWITFQCGECRKKWKVKLSALKDSVEKGDRWRCPYCGSFVSAFVGYPEVVKP